MNFFGFSYAQREGMIRRATSSGMSLLIVASFLAAPSTLTLLPTASFAAPAPFIPDWILTILADADDGFLTTQDLDELAKRTKLDPDRARNVARRLTQSASRKGLTFTFTAKVMKSTTPGTPDTLEIVVTYSPTKNITYSLGPVTSGAKPQPAPPPGSA